MFYSSHHMRYDDDDDNNDDCHPQHNHHHIAKWQTISSICLARWMGQSAIHMPMSWSEASWTGLFNFTKCCFEPRAMQLLPQACRQALPRVADFDGSIIRVTSADDNKEKKGFPNINNKLEEQEMSVRQMLQGGIQQQRLLDGSPNPYWDRWPELRGASSSPSSSGGSGSDKSYNNSGGCRLFLGIGDGACANIGSKCSDASRIAVTVGTSAAARVCLPLPVVATDDDDDDDRGDTPEFHVPPGLFCYRINQSHVLLGGALTDGGSVVEWVSSLTNLTATPDAFEDCMAQVEKLLQSAYATEQTSASSNTTMAIPLLTVVPFLSGERSTGFRDGATGAILGLTRETTAAHLLRACLEGVTLRIHAIVSLIQNVLANDYNITDDNNQNDSIQIVTSGKALEVNHVWRQMMADCTGLNVVLDEDVQESTSRGVALLMATSLSNAHQSDSNSTNSMLSRREDLAPHAQKSTPNLFATQRYWRRASEMQEQLIHAVTPLYQT
jgi:gluconokinase